MARQEQELDITAYIKTESERQQFDILMRVFEIFRERSEVRGDLWADFDAADALRNMESKLARIGAALKTHAAVTKVHSAKTVKLNDALVDDALDLCNYAVFLIRHIEGAKP